MSRRFNGHSRAGASSRRPDGPPLDAAAEAAVRQLIGVDDHAAVEQAKKIDRTHRSAASEALLVDAYAARIRSLFRRNLPVEAKALIELVRQRYPSARTRLGDLGASVEPRTASLHGLLRPLTDPGLSAEDRLAIDRTIAREVWDLGALATADALPPDHSLRTAAAALERAFISVTTGPVVDAALELPEVSHRSPLAPWKRLVRAIACFYRGDDDACRRHVSDVPPDSAPGRLVPVMGAMLQGAAPARQSPAAAALYSGVIDRPAALRSGLHTLDAAFASRSEGRIVKAARTAIQECRRSLPGQLDSLQQGIMVRCAAMDMDDGRIFAAVGGERRRDASFLRLLARTMEEAGDPESVTVACSLWSEFRQQAPREGWFAANGPEVAMLDLRMADLLRRLPDDLLLDLQQTAGRQGGRGEDSTFLFPDRLYARACVLDPNPEAFAQWMDWARRRSPREAERVAEAWQKIRPRDLEPVLYLMEAASGRRAFPAALRHLAQAERIDGMHAGVRRARVRLLTGSALRHVQLGKPVLADAELDELAALPHAQQGDRPAVLAALRCLVSAARGKAEEARAFRAETARLLESRAAAAILLSVMATAAKAKALDAPGSAASVERLSDEERTGLPMAVSRIGAILEDVQLPYDIPAPWMAETAKQFRLSGPSLAIDQLRLLGETALAAGQAELAYAVSTCGIERGGASAARFLLLRARSLPATDRQRRAVCAAAAAALGRAQRDMALVDHAVDIAGDASGLVLSADQASDVLEQEKAQTAWPAGRRRGPDYDAVINPCQCVACRRARGEPVDPFDDDDDEDGMFEIPPGMPPELAEMLFEETRQAVLRGESLGELMARLGGGRPRPRKRRKGRRT